MSQFDILFDGCLIQMRTQLLPYMSDVIFKTIPLSVSDWSITQLELHVWLDYNHRYVITQNVDFVHGLDVINFKSKLKSACIQALECARQRIQRDHQLNLEDHSEFVEYHV